MILIRSMTGFGAARFEAEGVLFVVEARAVNHRHLDLRVRLPRVLAALEPDVRRRVQARLARGKVDLVVSAGGGGGAGLTRPSLDLEAAGRYLEAAARLREERGVPGELDVATLLALPGVAQLADVELSAEAVAALLGEAVDRALAALVAMREAEGAAIERDLRERLARVARLADALEPRAEAVVRSVREKLRKRAQQLHEETGLLDEARLHQEVVLAADRLDVSEELVRLRSHVEQFAAILDAADGGGVGRRLDFLLQELGREANTLGSKGADSELAHGVVELKAELERVREQVQNVE